MIVACIPTHNESEIITATIKRVATELNQTGQSWTILVADNGSTDDTATVVERAKVPQVTVIRVTDAGKGLAIRNAAEQAQLLGADIFGFVDADLSADISTLPACLMALQEGADMVVGSRFLQTNLVNRGCLRTLSSRVFNGCSRLFLPIDVRDSQCGMKWMNQHGQRVLLSCREKTWFLDLELLVQAKLRGLKVVELPVAWEEFRYPKRRSKLHILRDGWSVLSALYRIRGRL